MRTSLIALLVLISGCYMPKLNASGHRVPLAPAGRDVSGCQYRGPIVGWAGGSCLGFFFGWYAPNRTLLLNAMSDARNRTALVGGNTLVVVSSQVDTLTTATVTGIAYACPGVTGVEQIPDEGSDAAENPTSNGPGSAPAVPCGSTADCPDGFKCDYTSVGGGVCRPK